MTYRTLLVASAVLATSALSWPAAAYTVFVSNEKDNTISIIDGKKNEVIETIEVGKRPRGITLSKDFKTLYICASDSDTVQVMDVATRKILHNLPSGADPEQFALSPDDRHLYVSNEDDNIVTVVDTVTREVVAQYDTGIEPEGMAVSHNGLWAVNTSETTNMVHWIDTTKGVMVDNTLVGQRPRHAEFTKDDAFLWVSAEIGGTVSVIDVSTKKIIQEIKFSVKGVQPDQVQPVGVKFDKDNTYAFVALGPANHVAVVNMKTYEVEDTLLVGQRVWHMDITPDGAWAYTSNGVSGDVSVIDVANRKVVKSIKVGRYPWGVAIAP